MLKAKEINGYSYDRFKNLNNMKIQYEREQLYDPTWITFLYDSGFEGYINWIEGKYNLSQDDAVKSAKRIAY